VSARIIAGTAGGRRIRTPTGSHTRPTTDRVREALFSAFESATGSIIGLRFLDLYAGSGAVGLEARSRGASFVTLVESDRRTAVVIRENVRSLGFSGVEVTASTVARAVAQPPRAPYDLAFLDPPYSVPGGEVTAALGALHTQGWLAEGAVVVVERSSRTPAVVWPAGLVGRRERKYGETTLWYGHAAAT
jgi:16S rRNA (guanine966-N2)-methyltransferase